MKQSKKTRQESALKRRKKELAFWKSSTAEVIVEAAFGKAARHLTNYETADHAPTKSDLEAMIKMKIETCEEDIKNLEAKL